MDSVNKHIVVGYLGNDPKVQQNDKGHYGGFNVATSDSYKDQNGQWKTITEWHRVKVTGFLAEIALRDLRKGSRVYVSGKSRKRKWVNDQSVEIVVTEIHAEELVVLTKLQSQDQAQDASQGQPQQQQRQTQQQRQPQQQDDWVTNPDF